MTVKQKALEHYDRMIKWAEKRFKWFRVNRIKMYRGLGETWLGDYCSYCEHNRISDGVLKHYLNCGCCELKGHIFASYCCDGLWHTMNKSKTWGTWVKKAKEVRAYIKKHG